MSTLLSPATYLARDLISALNFFRDTPTDGLTLSMEENRHACLHSPACTRAATLLQFLLSALLLVGTVLFTKDSLLALATEPMVVASSESLPAPDLISRLFERAAVGDIASLSCPCSRSQFPLGNISARLDFEMDSLAKFYRYPQESDGAVRAFFEELGGAWSLDPGLCVTDPAQLAKDLGRVLGGVLDDSSPISPSVAAARLVNDTARALCEFAFGLGGTSDSSTWKPHFPMSACGGAASLAPWRLASFKGKELFPFLQAGRNVAFRGRLGGTISTLELYARQLAASSSARTIVTQGAVSPAELQTMAMRAFEDELGAFGALVAGLVPGIMADALSETSFAPALALGYLTPPAALSEATNLYSCPLPFGRTDFGPSTFFGLTKADGVDGGSGFFYVTPPPTAGDQVVLAAGRAALRVNASNLASFFAYPFSAAGFDAFSTQSFLAGNDFLTVLDACARGDSLSIEVYSLFPGSGGGGGGGGGAWAASAWANVSASKCCSKFGGVAFPSPPLFTVPVSCPGPLVELGRQRAASSLGGPAFESRLRLTLASLFAKLEPRDQGMVPSLFAALASPLGTLTPPLESLLAKVSALYNAPSNSSSDLQDRASILSTLLIDLTSVNVTADPLRYYRACAPRQCSWIEGTFRTPWQVFYEALDKVGGTYGAIMGFLFALYVLCFLVARAFVRWGAAAAAAAGAAVGRGGGVNGSGGGKGEVGGGDTFIDGAKTGGVLLMSELKELREMLAAQGKELAELRAAVMPRIQPTAPPAIFLRHPEMPLAAASGAIADDEALL